MQHVLPMKSTMQNNSQEYIQSQFSILLQSLLLINRLLVTRTFISLKRLNTEVHNDVSGDIKALGERVKTNRVFWSSRTLRRRKKSFKNKTDDTEDRSVRDGRVRKITYTHYQQGTRIAFGKNRTEKFAFNELKIFMFTDVQA